MDAHGPQGYQDQRVSVNLIALVKSVLGLGTEAATAVPSFPEAEVRQLARDWAQGQGLHWVEPSECSYDPKSRVWSVRSNASGKGFSVRVTLDDVAGQVIGHHVYPR